MTGNNGDTSSGNNLDTSKDGWMGMPHEVLVTICILIIQVGLEDYNTNCCSVDNLDVNVFSFQHCSFFQSE